MPKEDLPELIELYLNGKATNAQKESVNLWYKTYEATDAEFYDGDVRKIRAAQGRSWIALNKKINADEHAVLIRKLIPYLATAAAIAAVVFGIWFYSSTQSITDCSAEIAILNDVDPGKNTAILTLSDGKTIHLSDSKTGLVVKPSIITYSDGTSLTSVSPKGGDRGKQILTAATPRGGTYMVTLPDGSKIRLNAASTLKFPSTFNKLNTRTVELRGEAYFDVSHNPSQPFIIKSGNQEIKVLGTHFNLNTYDGNSMKTTLISGSVQVSLLQEPDQKRVLKPGEQAIANNRSLEIVKVDTAIAVGWKNNEFIFKDEKFETVLNRLSSWYDVDFEYTGKKPDFRITGFMGRKEKLSKVLATIASNGKVKFKIEGRVVHVMN